VFSLDCRVCGASVGFSSAILYLPFSQLIAEDVAMQTIR